MSILRSVLCRIHILWCEDSMNLPVLGAWLHDIGKFAQRAREEERSPLEHEYCPQYNGRYTHQHVLYTDYFIKHILPLPDELENMRGVLADLAASHHRASEKSREHQAIQLADELSAGMDRTECAREGDFVAERLNSVFAKVRLNGKGLDGDDCPPRYRLAPLGGDDAVFPVKSAVDGQDYPSFWQEFVAEARQLPCNLGVNAWRDSLVSLLERYCWCVPSAAWRSLPDVSLYDHCAATAAITQAMLGCAAGEERFLLFGGELSGIQAFIFGQEEPADKGAVRLLRARSFLLQAVTRSVWLTLLRRLNLDPAAKIMDAGGRFVLLLPHTDEVLRQLDTLEGEVENWLLEKFLGAVRLNFGRLALCVENLDKKTFADKFDQFNEVLEEAKLRPFSRSFAAGLSPWLPVRYADYASLGECAFCHVRPGAELEDGQPLCTQCRQLKELGSALPATRFIAFSAGGTGGGKDFANLLFDGIGLLFDGIGLQFYESMPPESEARRALQILSIRNEPVFTLAPIAGHIPVIREEDLRRWRQERRLADMGGDDMLPGSPHVGGPKTFGMLAEEARVPPAREGEPWTSVPCLAICKADVDNLGLIFSMGFDGNFSLSSYAMLARMLNYFFSGCLMQTIRREFPNVYVVFAGGDDVFVMGPWAETVDFALRMAADFRRFCGDNPAVTLSAGMPWSRLVCP